jgi:hypothetical protein
MAEEIQEPEWHPSTTLDEMKKGAAILALQDLKTTGFIYGGFVYIANPKDLLDSVKPTGQRYVGM